MKSNPLKQRLLSVYRQANREGDWSVADHLLAALEASRTSGAASGRAVVEAYRILAEKAARLK